MSLVGLSSLECLVTCTFQIFLAEFDCKLLRGQNLLFPRQYTYMPLALAPFG